VEQVELRKTRGLRGEITPPPDKSISHRAVICASLAEGKSRVRNLLKAEDPVSTTNAVKMLGVEIQEVDNEGLLIQGRGLFGLKEPFDVINCGNSGTTIRLLSGVLAGSPFFSVFTGDDSLKQRPMARIIRPLKEMGAEISGRAGDRYPPLAIKGRALNPIEYAMPMASAQVKSCLIFAGLYADGITALTEPYKSRDHTERMLAAMGVGIEVEGLTIKVKGFGSRTKGQRLGVLDVTVPADFSSAAFFIAACLLVPDSEILINGVGINPTRTGFLDVISDMGARIELINARQESGEPVADIHCKTSGGMRGIIIGKERIPSLIDEFPILCILATQADGFTEIRGAEELRVKESDRIKVMAAEMKKFGVELEEYPDGIAIKGKASLIGSEVESHGDHRVAMSLSIAGLIAEGTTTITNASCVGISYPGFYETLERLKKGIGR
jgi:3-phosphoshikimate 1-carboxyvinyltransferase